MRILACFSVAAIAGVLALCASLPVAAQFHDTWLVSQHTCPGGSGTDALFQDPDGRIWVGCGSAATGYGLSVSYDMGASWEPPQATPAGILNEFRVSSISLGRDGHLKIAGFDATTKNMVLSLDISGTPAPGAVYAATPVLVGVAQVGRQFHVGTYREKHNRSMAEALTGASVLHAPDGTGSSASDWTTMSPGGQMTDLVVHDNRFWATGSTISEPPTLFLPPENQNATAPMTPAVPVLPTSWSGELWGLAVNGQRLVATGVHQGPTRGKILVSGPDPRDMNGYAEVDISAAVLGTPSVRTWGRGVCMRGDTVVVVGERRPLSSHTGLVLLSGNGGAGFSDITPDDVDSTVSKCLFMADGSLLVAGSGGFVGVLPADAGIFADGFEGPLIWRETP
ncbi:sialidase family protein [Castellaniella sp.]|uniref:sialidase family protein n=1 Tax=Castellaniella sp. TaxID=1955812 RepID=UPI003565481B